MEFADFQKAYLQNLNPQQQEAVLAAEGPVLVLATPGSGKTRVLITRLGYMTLCLGVDPRSILTVTYTRAAAADLRRRCETLFGRELSAGLTFRTINGLSAKIIAYAGARVQREVFSLLEGEGERTALIREVLKEMTGEYPDDNTIREAGNRITYVKNMLLTEDEIATLHTEVKNFPEVYRRYQKALRSRRSMDYDDQARYALNLLRQSPQLLQAVRGRYRWFCVDEAQDTSRLQHCMIRLLAAESENLFMVGDEDQSIYAFRAAFPEALMHFEQDHPGARILLIEQNYRSTPEIIGAANRFVAGNRFRREKKIVPTRESGAPVRVIPVLQRKEQYEILMRLAPGWTSETAILFRNNESALPLIDFFEQKGIPYRCRNFDALFFSHRMVRDMTDILRFAWTPWDRDVFLRIYYRFSAGISRVMAEQAVRRSAATGEALFPALLHDPELRRRTEENIRGLIRCFDLLKTDTAEAALRRVYYQMGYQAYEQQVMPGNDRFFILQMLAAGVPDVPSYLQKLEALRKTVSGENRTQPGAPGEPGERIPIVLSTIHSSKGLEYERVYLLDAVDGVLPASDDGADPGAEEQAVREYEEERRLFYVGITRARDELCLFSLAGKNRFIRELLPPEKQKKSLTGLLRSSLTLQKRGQPDTGAFLAAAKVGGRVIHRSFGKGTITEIKDGMLRVRFDTEGERLLLLSAAIPYLKHDTPGDRS